MIFCRKTESAENADAYEARRRPSVRKDFPKKLELFSFGHYLIGAKGLSFGSRLDSVADDVAGLDFTAEEP